MDTIFLNPDTWDLDIDADRNIALATSAYALAQDTASECKLFKGEYKYDTAKGIPYNDIFHAPSFNRLFYASQLEKAALGVPEVVKAKADVRIVAKTEGTRQISEVAGSIKITSEQGKEIEIGI